MRVAITDYTFPDLSLEQAILHACGATVMAGQCMTAETLIPLVAEADAVITQFAPIHAPVIKAMQRAKVIVRYGIGVDNVDLEAARLRGIPVCNIPDYCIDEVADHTLAFLLAATRNVVPNTQHIRQGEWGLAVPLTRMRTLKDLVVGVVGFGRIGREVVSRLRPFKCRLLVHDPVVPHREIEAAQARPVGMEELLASSDAITLHCPSTKGTRHLLNRATIGQMKPGAIVVNLGRGDLIETTSLVAALESGHVSAAALDVFEQEPLPADSPFRSLPHVVVASHIASTSEKAVRTLRETAAQIAARALRGEPLPNIVNQVNPVNPQ